MPDPFTVSDWQIDHAPAGLVVTLTSADGRTLGVTFPLGAVGDARDAYGFAEQLERDVLRWELDAEHSAGDESEADAAL